MTILEENNLIKAAEQLYLSPSTAGSAESHGGRAGLPAFERERESSPPCPHPGLAFSHIASQMLAFGMKRTR